MRRMRAGLLFAVAVPLALAGPLAAQVAPTLTGETGLFELRNAETVQPGRFSFGLYYSQSDRVAAPSLLYPYATESPLLYGTGKLGFTLGFGATQNWELTLSTGQRYYTADARDWAGAINGHDRYGEISHNETDKIRFGSKLVVNTKDPVKVALFGGFSIPTQTNSDSAALSTNRTDWDFGLSANYGVMTAQVSYVNNSDYKDAIGNHAVPKELRWGLGVGIPIIPKTLRLIGEVNRTHYDGGSPKPDDFSEILLGGRFGGGGLSVGAAVRANIDRWVKYGSKPSSIGGIIQVAYLTPAATDDRMRVTSSAAEEPAPVTPAPTPAPTRPAPTTSAPETAPAPKTETSTTDEILFDAAKSRLTNIAKAILDGVALRLKNNLSATCTVVAYTDPKEKGGDHTALAKARAEAAKDYLMKRHGIDGSRVKVETKGDEGAGSDATRNRRAVVTVTFP